MNARKRELGKHREENEKQNNQENSQYSGDKNLQIPRTHCATQRWKVFQKKQLSEVSQYQGPKEDLTRF